MKRLIVAALLLLNGLAIEAQCDQNHQHEASPYREIHAQQLKAWYDEGKAMQVVDARSKPYFEGTLLPKAIWLPHDVPQATLHQALPAKDGVIVVYCWSTECPASHYLLDRLKADGYTNLYHYPEGLQDWIQKGFPTTKTQLPGESR